MHQTISWGCHNGKEPSIKTGGWGEAAEGAAASRAGASPAQGLGGQMSPLPGASLVGEGLGQGLDPRPASRVGGLSRAWTGSSSFFGTVWRRTCSRKPHFPAAVGPFCLCAGGGGGRAGQRCREPSLLHRGYTLENPGGSALRGPRQAER